MQRAERKAEQKVGKKVGKRAEQKVGKRVEQKVGKKQMTARNLSAQGLSVEQIAQAVGFSVEAVKEWLTQKDV